MSALRLWLRHIAIMTGSVAVLIGLGLLIGKVAARMAATLVMP